jgi:hypothetical protein
VLGKRSGNRDDPTATDEFGERSNPDASTASVFGKIREPGTGRPPTENWNPYGPIAEAIRKSITVSVSGAIMKEELDSGRQTNSVTSRQDEMAGHYRVLEEVHEELDTLLDLEDPQPTRERKRVATKITMSEDMAERGINRLAGEPEETVGFEMTYKQACVCFPIYECI